MNSLRTHKEIDIICQRKDKQDWGKSESSEVTEKRCFKEIGSREKKVPGDEGRQPIVRVGEGQDWNNTGTGKS